VIRSPPATTKCRTQVFSKGNEKECYLVEVMIILSSLFTHAIAQLSSLFAITSNHYNFKIPLIASKILNNITIVSFVKGK